MCVCLCCVWKSIAIFFESACAIFRDKKQWYLLCSDRTRGIRTNDRASRHSTMEQTYVLQYVEKFHKQVPSHQPLNKATVNTKKRRYCWRVALPSATKRWEEGGERASTWILREVFLINFCDLFGSFLSFYVLLVVHFPEMQKLWSNDGLFSFFRLTAASKK